jgi:hypothetical protein
MRILRRGIAAIALSVAAAATILGASAGAANAASAMTVRLTPTSNLLLNVEVYGASYDDGAPIDQWTVNAGANQIWTFQPYGGGYEIVNAQSGKCITTDSTPGDTVYQWTCEGGTAQIWYTGLQPGNGYSYPIRSAASGLYLDVNGDSPWAGANIDTWYWNGGLNQYFAGTSA